jgi:hypothetical protein
MIGYLQEGILPDNDIKANQLIKDSNNYEIVDNQLIRLASYSRKYGDKINPLQKQLCIPPSLVLPIIEETHTNFGHANSERVYYTIRQSQYWKGMFRDIQNFVDSCESCLINRHRKRPDIPLTALQIPENKLSFYAIDHHGPIVTKDDRCPYKYVLLVKEMFTTYTLLIPAKTTSAQETVELLHKHVFLNFGFATKILSDRNSSFINELMEHMMRLTKCKAVHSAPYHPRCNGAVEVCNKWLTNGLRSYIKPQTKNWPDLLPILQFGNATLVSPQLGLSAFQLMYNVQPKMPIDVQILNETRKVQDKVFVDTYLPKWEILHDICKTNIAENKERMTYYHNLKAKAPNFKVGDRVYKLIEATPSNYKDMSKKLIPQYDGPYLITSLTPNTARLQNITTGKEVKTMINLSKLKLARF